MVTPTLVDMPQPPSNPDTPTDVPGTPNSATTSMSGLSTIAIKDGHRGHANNHFLGHHHTPSSNTLEAERADRISRLAGLERVSTARPLPPSAAGQIPGYFDQAGNPVYTTRMSTVGTASATGSAGGRTTTWASGSTKNDDDEVSMDANFREIDERDRYSASAMDEDGDGMSDEASLVGFGEGAGSTVSGPTYSRSNLGRSVLNGQLQDRMDGGADEGHVEAQGGPGSNRASGYGSEAVDRGHTESARQGQINTSNRASGQGQGTEAAERIMRDRIDGEARSGMASPEEAGLGKFYFEEKK